MIIPLLNDIVIVFGLAIVVLIVCHRLRLPSIVGFLLTGLLVGPHGLALVAAVHEVEVMAEIGVILLLFAIGIEFSLKQLLQIKRIVLIGGLLQVSLTACITAASVMFLNMPAGEAVFLGFLFALSSTAIVLKLLQDKAEVESPHGRTSLAILIFQDIVIVPMILVTPLLAGGTVSLDLRFLLRAAGGLTIVFILLASAKWGIPRILYLAARTRSRELFLLSIVVICFAIARLTAAAGLSLALGAFLAGLIISESEYGHHTLGDVQPFRDLFTSFFFVSIGMLLDVGFFLKNPVVVLGTTALILAGKTLVATATALLLGFPLRTALLAGLALCQIGEFSFVLSKTGVAYGLLVDHYQLFLAVSGFTMAATPFIMSAAPRFAEYVDRLPIPARIRDGRRPQETVAPEKKQDHLVIVGFGVTGRNLAKAARLAGIKYIIVEMNPETVQLESGKGEAIAYGDATREAVLEHVNLRAARVAVLAINDPAAVRSIVATIKRINPKIHLIVRTRYLSEVESLYNLNADQVIPEEFETSVEIFTRVLTHFLVPKDEIERFVADIRSTGYEMLRSLSRESTSYKETRLQLPDVDIVTFRLGAASPFVGKSLAETELRKQHGVSVLAIRRAGRILANPDVHVPFQSDDIVYVLGAPEKIAAVTPLFQGT